MMSDAGPGLVVDEQLARGESSDIFRARVHGDERVLKVLHPHLAEDPIVSNRFVREAEILASVRHPNIVRVHGLCEWEGRPAIVMEYVAGGSLTDRLAAGALETGDAERLVREILAALDAIHARGIIHRDVRPSHVLLATDGSVRLADFGMASVRDLSGLTRSTVFTSRPNYADPFTWGTGQRIPQVDLYGVGAVAYECCTGSPPPVRLFGERGIERDRFLGDFARDHSGSLGWLVPLLLASLDRRPRSAAEALAWLETKTVSGVRDLSECLFCGAPVPREAPLCLECGREPLRVRTDPNGEFIALRSVKEAQEVLSPFLRKLRLLSDSADPLAPLLIGDQRLYSKAEKQAGIRLPVRIAENLASESATALISLLEGDRPDAVRIVRHPMSAAGRVKRGPLIRIRSGVQLPLPTLEAVRALADRAVSRSDDRSREETESAIRRECHYSLAIAAARIDAPEPELIAELGRLLEHATERLEQMEAYLAAIDLPAAYAEYERSAVTGDSVAGGNDKASRVFAEHADLERRATELRVAITRACRTLERVTGEGGSGARDEVLDILGDRSPSRLLKNLPLTRRVR